MPRMFIISTATSLKQTQLLYPQNNQLILIAQTVTTTTATSLTLVRISPHQLLWLLQPPRTTTSILRTRLPHRITTTTFQTAQIQHCPLVRLQSAHPFDQHGHPLQLQTTITSMIPQQCHLRKRPCDPVNQHCPHSPTATTSQTSPQILPQTRPTRRTTTTFQTAQTPQRYRHLLHHHFALCPQHCRHSPTATTTQTSPRILPLSIQRTRPTRRTTTTTFQTAQTPQRYRHLLHHHFPFCPPHCRHSPTVTTRTFPQTLRIPVTHQLLLRRHPQKLRLKNPY